MLKRERLALAYTDLPSVLKRRRSLMRRSLRQFLLFVAVAAVVCAAWLMLAMSVHGL